MIGSGRDKYRSGSELGAGDSLIKGLHLSTDLQILPEIQVNIDNIRFKIAHRPAQTLA